MLEIEFIEVNKDNYKKAIEIQQKLFPYENGDIDIMESVNKRKKTYNTLKYYLVRYKTKCIGITGYYVYDIYPDRQGSIQKFCNQAAHLRIFHNHSHSFQHTFY